MKLKEENKKPVKFSSISAILVLLTLYLNFENSYFYIFYIVLSLISLFMMLILYSYKKIKWVWIEKPDALLFSVYGFAIALVTIPLITSLTSFNIFLRVSLAGIIESVFIVSLYQIIPLKKYGSVIIASGIFAYLHLQIFQFNLILVFTAFVFSVICIIMSIKAESYLPAILIHLIWNLFAGFNQ